MTEPPPTLPDNEIPYSADDAHGEIPGAPQDLKETFKEMREDNAAMMELLKESLDATNKVLANQEMQRAEFANFRDESRSRMRSYEQEQDASRAEAREIKERVSRLENSVNSHELSIRIIQENGK